ncbi:MAG: bL35 family ribosomal protein [bacterium]|nr:bL35 family ribosomal protein [bacterium]
MAHRTRKSAVKRFRVTKNGKVLHRHHCARHLRSNKSKRQLRDLKKMNVMTGKQAVKVKQMLGLA